MSGHIDGAIDALGDVLKRYLLATSGGDRQPVTPVLTFSWTSVFDRAWREPNP